MTQLATSAPYPLTGSSMSGSSTSGDDLAPVTVLSVPAAHPYALRVSAAAGIRLLPDPPVPGAPEGTWWPPVALDPEWITAHRDAADLLHIHFGTESFAEGHLTRSIDAAHANGWPVVYTVHDLQHPQLPDQDAYGRQLDELVRGADALVTLTDGAAAVIRERWGRHAEVIAHPSCLDADTAAPHVRPSETVRIGVHLKDLRPNVDGPGTVAAVISAVEGLRAAGVPATAEVRMHHHVRDEVAGSEVRALCAASPDTALIEHERLTDVELSIALSRLDACVLPYRHGTHSGWLEMCWDLAIPVAAPTVGFYAEQHPDASVASFAPGDSGSLEEALARLLSDPSATRSGSDERSAAAEARRRERLRSDAAAADAHAALYRRLLVERSA